MKLDTQHPKHCAEITTTFGTSGIRLDFGCGQRKRVGFLGIDIRPYGSVDILCDATRLIPLPDNSVVDCYSYHTLEHIESKHYVRLFREIHRVCGPGAKIDWWVPYWTHRTAYNWSHVSILNEYCFEGRAFQEYFEIDRFEYTYEGVWKEASVSEQDYARVHLMNSVSEMRIVFRPRK